MVDDEKMVGWINADEIKIGNKFVQSIKTSNGGWLFDWGNINSFSPRRDGEIGRVSGKVIYCGVYLPNSVVEVLDEDNVIIKTGKTDLDGIFSIEFDIPADIYNYTLLIHTWSGFVIKYTFRV